MSQSVLPRTGRTSSGTTMMEVLVVMVVFLVGILAIVQIFPKGFQILLATRNNSVASALARDEVERLKARQDQIAEMIVPVMLSGGTYVADPSFNPDRLGPMGDTLQQDGMLLAGGTQLGNWQLFSGPNTIRRVIGEGGRVPAPRLVGANANFFGGLMTVEFGPIAYSPAQNNISVYGNDLAARYRTVGDADRWTDGEFFVTNPNTSAITLWLPSGPTERAYRVAFSAYTTGGDKRDYVDLPLLTVPASATDVYGRYPLYSVPVDAYVVGLSKWVPDSIASVDTNTLRAQRAYKALAAGDLFTNDPYEYKLLDNRVGVLLFNPVAASVFIQNPSGREPLEAKVNYDVYDWRILRDDFRLSPAAGTQQHKLPLGGLKVGEILGPDGKANGSITILENAPSDPSFTDDSPANQFKADNFVVVDLETGGLLMERAPGDPVETPNPLIVVNKSSGLVTFRDSDGNLGNGTTGKLLLPDKTVQDVALENRALRVLYRTREEFAVQVLKAASRYTSSPTQTLGIGQYYVGGPKPWAGGDPGGVTRIYFPPMDGGRKVNLGEVNYFAGGQARQILGNDFVIRVRPGDTLPSVDIQELDSSATGFDFSSGAAVQNVRGASVAVRVLWNPETFTLSPNNAQNMSRLETYGQSWRRSTNETFLQRGELVR